MPAGGVIGTLVSLISGAVSNIVAAGIILFIGFIAGRLLGRLAERVLEEIELDRTIYHATKTSVPAAEAIGYLITYFIYFLAIVMALDALKIKVWLFNLVSIAIIAIITGSIALSLKDFVSNVFAGAYIHQRGMVRKGDTLAIGGMEGTVISVDLAETKIEVKEGDTLFVPNLLIMQKTAVIRKRAKKGRHAAD
ncbi:mechanosensitive ion channel family protein, partial [Candidatus Woesearchaeota archaeon]|nr:mechanosensitive ion channel family protein [Candidatus Woesearchaeota archaeon]